MRNPSFAVVDTTVNLERAASLRPPGGVGFGAIVEPICMVRGVRLACLGQGKDFIKISTGMDTVFWEERHNTNQDIPMSQAAGKPTSSISTCKYNK